MEPPSGQMRRLGGGGGANAVPVQSETAKWAAATEDTQRKW